jgi:hypothetical protein
MLLYVGAKRLCAVGCRTCNSRKTGTTVHEFFHLCFPLNNLISVAGTKRDTPYLKAISNSSSSIGRPKLTLNMAYLAQLDSQVLRGTAANTETRRHAETPAAHCIAAHPLTLSPSSMADRVDVVPPANEVIVEIVCQVLTSSTYVRKGRAAKNNLSGSRICVPNIMMVLSDKMKD